MTEERREIVAGLSVGLLFWTGVGYAVYRWWWS